MAAPTNEQLTKVAWVLFASLQAVLVWQGNRMVSMQDQLVNQGNDNQLKIATLYVDLAATNDKLSTAISELQASSSNLDHRLMLLADETKSIDRRVTRLEPR